MGCGYIIHGARLYRKFATIRNTPTQTIGAASVGRVALTGTVRETIDTTPLTAPITGDKSVYVEWEVTELAEKSQKQILAEKFGFKNDSETSTTTELHPSETIATGSLATSFVLEDESGTIRAPEQSVTSGTVTVRKETTDVIEGYSFPQHVQEFLADQNISLDEHTKYRFTQSYIPLNDSVFVFAESTPCQGNEGHRVQASTNCELVSESVTDNFHLGNFPREDVFRTGRLSMRRGLAYGSVQVFLSLGFLAVVLG